jgi:DNA-binding transcriptional MerR regulator
MKIGEIAQQAGVSASIIRYYERKGVLPRATRDACGYRDYGAADLARVRLVRGARRLGCSFVEIQNIIAMQEEASIPASDLLELLEHKVVEVGDEIDRLRLVQTELSRLHNVALSLARDHAADYRSSIERMDA